MNFRPTKLIQLSLLILSILFFIACGEGEKQPQHIPSTEHGKSAAYNSTYVCPMHCSNSGSDEAGICPGCGMNYVLLSEHTRNGHSH